MGQYYYIVNLTKKQFLHPHKFGDGLKLLEFGCSGDGTMTALAVLLSDGNGRGGGDLHAEHPLIGSWAGDRIVIAGDYADAGKWDASEKKAGERGEEVNLYHLAAEHYEGCAANSGDALSRRVEALELPSQLDGSDSRSPLHLKNPNDFANMAGIGASSAAGGGRFAPGAVTPSVTDCH